MRSVWLFFIFFSCLRGKSNCESLNNIQEWKIAKRKRATAKKKKYSHTHFDWMPTQYLRMRNFARKVVLPYIQDNIFEISFWSHWFIYEISSITQLQCFSWILRFIRRFVEFWSERKKKMTEKKNHIVPAHESILSWYTSTCKVCKFLSFNRASVSTFT